MTDLTGAPTRLQSGGWGVRVPLPDRDSARTLCGQEITVRTRTGKTWKARLADLIWSGSNKYGDGDVAIFTLKERPASTLVGIHTNYQCSCGNWSGAGSPCLYSYGEAKREGEARFIRWERKEEQA